MEATQANNGVLSSLAAHHRATGHHLENFKTIYSTISEASQSMGLSQYAEGIEKAKQAVLRLVQTEMALKAHNRALEELQRQYQPPEGTEETDFLQVLDAATANHLEEPFDAEQSSQFQAYLGLAQTQTQEAEEDEDDELRIERGNDLAPNRTCPLSQKELLSLDEPVEDSKGFVYEKEAVVDFISRPAFNGKAPISGADHSLSLSDLRPARKVMKAQRKAKNQPTQTQAADDDILDVD